MWSMTSSLSSRGSLVRYDFVGSIGSSGALCRIRGESESESDWVAHGGADISGSDLNIEILFTSLSVCECEVRGLLSA